MAIIATALVYASNASACRQQCQETETTWSCRTWTRTRRITSKWPPSMLMEQEERWMVTDAQVQAVPSARPRESLYSISERYWSAASRKSERTDSLMRFLRNWTLYQTWNKWYCWLLKKAKILSCLHSSEGDRILIESCLTLLLKQKKHYCVS